MCIAVPNRILLTMQLIPSKNLALKRTTDTLRRKKVPYWIKQSRTKVTKLLGGY